MESEDQILGQKALLHSPVKHVWRNLKAHHQLLRLAQNLILNCEDLILRGNKRWVTDDPKELVYGTPLGKEVSRVWVDMMLQPIQERAGSRMSPVFG